MRPRTGGPYSEDRSLELARSWSAALQSRLFRSETLMLTRQPSFDSYEADPATWVGGSEPVVLA